MKKASYIFILVLMLLNASCKDKTEITVKNAIQIAVKTAKTKNYNTEKTAIEVIKYKKGIEKGPLRINLLLQSFPRNEGAKLLKHDFWMIYFYPERMNTLGGDFLVLVDLYSGEVIDSIAGM